MIVSGEKGLDPAAFPVVEIFCHSPGNTQPVKGTGPSADLIQNDQAFFSSIIQDVGGLLHFHHEGTLAFGKVIQRPNACKDSIHDPDGGCFRRNERTHLGHQYQQGYLAQER